MNEKLSIFGASGFIGSNFCQMYGQDIIKILRESRKPETNNILYLISTVDNYNVFEDLHIDINTNLNLLMEVLEECKSRPDLIFNFVSSWFVYGQIKDLPANEMSHCNPRGFYSITKRAAEQLIASYCETFGIKYRILRLCNVYGTGATKVSKKRNALQFLVGEVVRNHDVNLYDGGENIRDFLHVKDVCRAINLVTRKGPINEIINIGSGTPHRFKDMLEYVKQKTGSISKFISTDPPDFHKIVQVRDMYLDVSKLSELGFRPNTSIWKGLSLLIDDEKRKNNE